MKATTAETVAEVFTPLRDQLARRGLPFDVRGRPMYPRLRRSPLLAHAVHFEIPAEVARGLASGEMVRHGGVIQWATGTPKAGELVAWLREVSTGPSNPADIGRALGALGGPLQLVGAVASVLNLGATVAFGVATLRKLGKMEGTLGEMDGKLDTLMAGQDRIFGAVEVGFQQMALGFEQVLSAQAAIVDHVDQKFHEQVVVALRSAAKDMELVAGDGDDHRRVQDLGNILPRVSQAYEALAHDAELRTQELVASLRASDSGRKKLRVTNDGLTALYRVRMACSAAAQKARVVAERGQPREAAKFLRAEHARLSAAVESVGRALLAGSASAYDELLHHHWADQGITPARVGRWARRFDPEAQDGLEGVMRRLQARAKTAAPHAKAVGREQAEVLAQGSSALRVLGRAKLAETLSSVRPSPFVLTHIDDIIDWSDDANVPAFLDLLDGAIEDLDRLEGHATEYDVMSSEGLRVAEYAERFRVEDVPEGAVLAVFVNDGDDAEEPLAARRIEAPQ